MASPTKTTIEMAHSKRVHQGLEPDFYDRINYSYPDEVTTRMTYIFDETNEFPLIKGIVECIYSDPTKTTLLSKTRII